MLYWHSHYQFWYPHKFNILFYLNLNWFESFDDFSSRKRISKCHGPWRALKESLRINVLLEPNN